MKVYDPTRRCQITDRECQVLGEHEGWRAARYHGDEGGGSWFAYRLVDNLSLVLAEAPESVRDALVEDVTEMVFEERLLEMCALVALCDTTALEEAFAPVRATVERLLTERDDYRIVERAAVVARRTYSEAIIATALTLIESGEALRSLALSDVEMVRMSELAEEDLDEGVRLQRARKWVSGVMVQLKTGIATEKAETKDAMRVFLRALKRALGGNDSPTPAELKSAIRQVGDVAKGTISTAVMLAPVPGVVVGTVGVEMLANRFGFSIFPTALKGLGRGIKLESVD